MIPDPQGVPHEDIVALIRDKYEGKASDSELEADLARLAAGEPLAYVIGWIPFLNLHIRLDSHPLIPRPETEWWTNELITHLRERFGDTPFHLLDLCAGSGAIGLAILSAFPNAHVSFGELMPEHVAQIKMNLEENNLDASRAHMYESDLFTAVPGSFDVIASNPPYIPQERALDTSVTNFEPPESLFGGNDGLGVIRRIALEAQMHLNPEGELWLEADMENVGLAKTILDTYGTSSSEIRTDQYGRQRFVVAYYP
ncbi:MAG: Release factor glutamine methyltransferase [Parcubacteria group bacterium]|nr:Release factor glutamine methyltransferase [Parcubacteria group bacterium]